MTISYLIAGGLMTVIASIHTFVGTRMDAAPLLASDIPEPARSTLYYCWHIVTIVLFGMAAAYILIGLRGETTSIMGYALTGLSAAFAAWGFLLAWMRKQSLFTRMPQGLLFLVVTAVSIFALSG